MNRAQFRQWSELVDDPLLLLDRSGTVLEINSSAPKLFQRERRELLSRRLHEFVADPTPLTDYLALCARTSEYLPGTMAVSRAGGAVACRTDGASSPDEASGSRLIVLRVRQKADADRGFELLNHAHQIERLGHEIEQRKRAQVALEEARAQLESRVQERTADLERANRELHELADSLRESEARFRALADHIPQLAWIADASGWIFWYNRRWFTYTGSTLEQMQGWGWQAVHHPDHVERVSEKFRAHLASGEIFEDTFPLRGAHGEFRWFLTRVIPLRDDTGVITRWFGTNTDVTEQRQIEDALRASNVELEQFAFVAAHDLQEPLRTISLYTELLLRKLATPDPQLQLYGERVRTAAQRMRTLLTDLLTYSRIVQQSTGEVTTVADLDEALEHARLSLADAITRSQALVTSTALPIVRGEVTQLAVVLQNLVANALKYQAEGSRPEIAISAQRAGERWIVSIRDNGIGFAPDHAERIFGLFKRLHGDDYPGTGLGLAICRRIVQRYGGRLWAESAGEGHGSTFVMELAAVAEA